MKNRIDTDLGKYTDVRYSKYYSSLMILLATIFISLGIISFLSEHFVIFQIFFIIVGLIMLIAGITLRVRKYLRLDKQNQTLMVFGTIGSLSVRIYPYDRIYLEGKKLYFEKNGKKKRLYIVRHYCDKGDFNTFIKEITG
jgi:hypothetical protein